MDPILVGLLLSMAMAGVVHTIAARKGYDGAAWGLGALFFWPVALVLILLKPKNSRLFRRCPDCGSTDVPFDVPVCKHCGRDERKHPAT